VITYIIRRLLYGIPVLIAATFIVYVFVTTASDPVAQIRLRPLITPAQVQRIVHENYLDRPVVVRYGLWARDAITQKFGHKLLSHQPIWPDLKRVLGHTLQLIIAALTISVLLAVAIGVYSAIRQYSPFDYAMTTFSFLGFATPVFWLALILQVIFTNIYLKWDVRIFYTAQLSQPHPGNFLLDRIQHLALPVTTLAVISIAQYSRYMRASMLEVINSDYVRTARAKGLTDWRVIMRHAFRNALIPIVTVVALDFGALFGGAIVTESVFTLDGMGYYFINALQAGDPNPVMAWLVIVAVMVILFNLIADILYGYLDPRIRYD
jgi:peptide/nickel transport system permease protein